MPASASMGTSSDLVFHPLTLDRWDALERLFGRNGAWGGCWCMWWRLTASEFSKRAGDPNREALRTLVKEGKTPGILAYADGEPVGWCSIAPREEFGRLQRSPILKPVDDVPVWSVVCFYVARDHRDLRLTTRLLEAAVEHAARQGAEVVEGYPLDPMRPRYPPEAAWTGILSAFREAGFEEVLRRKENRPIVRRVCRPGKDP